MSERGGDLVMTGQILNKLGPGFHSLVVAG